MFKFSPEGKLLLTLGKKGVIGDNESQRRVQRRCRPGHREERRHLHRRRREHQHTRRQGLEGRKVRQLVGRPRQAPGQFDEPHSIAIDSDGRLYVGDRRNKRVQVFDQGGKFLKEWTHLGTPWGVFVKGDRLYVVDGTENNCCSS